MKIGYEVEGKYKGIETFFIQDKEIDLFITKIEYLNNIYNRCKHLYICDTGQIDYEKINFLLNYFRITIETTTIPVDNEKSIYDNIHFMLRIDDCNIWKLKKTDSIKFHNSDNYVKSICLENMYLTKIFNYFKLAIIKGVL